MAQLKQIRNSANGQVARCRDRLRIGEVHRRIRLAPRWYLGAYAIYMQIVLPRVLAAFEYNRHKAHRAGTALVKLVALDQELALAAYFDEAPAVAESGGPGPGEIANHS